MAPPRTLEGKVAIVTGASRGIGSAIAFDLASRGAKVTITYSSDRSKAPADALVQRIQSQAQSAAIDVQCDLKTPEAPQRIIDATLKAFGPHIDILVNNAGIISGSKTPEITAEHFDEVFHTNVRAPLFMLQAALPHLKHPARIINISFIGARAGYPGTGTYSASKAALEGEMLDQVPKEIVEPQLQATPVEQRAGRSEEIAEVVAWLASEGSSWVSGQAISASGGYAMY
ncbi:dehydrogenase OXI1-like [Teratosphaeria destructans]|uniref:Dehydrogenase OXI1-like n=1 Tax=Teratosphaeria destructans TaxID=418781 RepID=A0A9W7VZ44_9PEZI|nr:dehydrogenase OXI1-like [Teratosphaeria destructans]